MKVSLKLGNNVGNNVWTWEKETIGEAMCQVCRVCEKASQEEKRIKMIRVEVEMEGAGEKE